MEVHLNGLTLRISLLTANDPAATYWWIASLLAMSGGMGVYRFGLSMVVDIADSKEL